MQLLITMVWKIVPSYENVSMFECVFIYFEKRVHACACPQVYF